MRIVVCIKQVPSREAPLQVDKAQLWLEPKDTRYETNEADQYALEQALCIKDRIGAEIIVLSLGSTQVLQVIKEALAKGADRAIHINHDQAEILDPYQQASAIAEAIAKLEIDLLLCGLQSDDMGFAQTGVMLAACLKLPHVSMVVEMEHQPGKFRVNRELESGWTQWHRISAPCVLSIQSGNIKPRYSNMKGILAAKKKPLQTISYSDLNANNINASQKLVRLYTPQKSKKTQFIEGGEEQIASDLLKTLRAHS